MIVDLTLRNYRAFSDAPPASIRFGPGFTALVGPNNSGKSSLLRFLYDFRALFELLKDQERVQQSLVNGQAFGFSPRYTSTEGLFHNGNDHPIGIEIIATTPAGDDANKVRLDIRYERTDLISVKHTPAQASAGLGPSAVYPDANLVTTAAKLSDTLYIGAFRNVLNFSPSSQLAAASEHPVYYDLRMGRQFVEWWLDMKSGRNRAGNETAYQLTQDIGRIFGLGALDINATPGAHELQLFVDGKSYRLEELGSGLTQLLVVLANAAFRRPSWILIDEPELNLHPALQLDFLTALASYARIGVVFATHSVGLARSVGERIYALRRGPGGSQQVHPLAAVPSLAEFLGELSFSAHRELGYETLLLVEGPTDVPVLQQLLRQIKKEREVVLLPLGGATTINARSDVQLSEIARLAPKVVALIDSERDVAGAPLSTDRSGFVTNCARLGIRCHVLERRATENYLPERAVRAVKGPSSRALGPYESLKNGPFMWTKSDNWRIAAATQFQELAGTDLGAFLLSL